MKLKTSFIMVALFAITFNVKAQFSKTDGNVTECKPSDYLSAIGQDNNAFYIYKNDLKAKQILIQRYNKKSLAKEWETALPLSVAGRGTKFTCLKDNQIYVYLPLEAKDNEILVLYVLGTDGKIITNAKQLYSANDTRVSYNYAVSPDSSKFLFYHHITGATKALVFDVKTGNILFDKSIPNVYQGSSTRYESHHTISNDGKIAYTFNYALGVKEPTILEEGNGYSASAKSSNFWMHHDAALAIGIFNPATGDVNVKLPNFEGKDKSTGSVGLNFLNNDKLLITFAAKEIKNNNKGKSGMYIAQVNLLKNTMDFESYQPFSDAWEDKYASAGWSLNRQYKVNTVEGGGVVISSLATTNFAQNFIWMSEGMIMKINAQGKTEWMRMIPISIKTNGDGVTSVFYNKKMYFFMNDNISNEKNIDINNVEAGKETKVVSRAFGDDVNTICVSYDMSGNAKRDVIQNNKDFALNPLDKVIFLDKDKILLSFKKETEGMFSILTIQ